LSIFVPRFHSHQHFGTPREVIDRAPPRWIKRANKHCKCWDQKADAKEMRMLLNDAEENDGAFPAKRVFELSRMQAPEGPRMVLAAKKRRDCG
jgi:uncharacterized protein YeaO (DUF488 family)